MPDQEAAELIEIGKGRRPVVQEILNLGYRFRAFLDRGDLFVRLDGVEKIETSQLGPVGASNVVDLLAAIDAVGGRPKEPIGLAVGKGRLWDAERDRDDINFGN